MRAGVRSRMAATRSRSAGESAGCGSFMMVFPGLGHCRHRRRKLLLCTGARIGRGERQGGAEVTRVEWQQLAERWLVDAKRLLDDHRWSAAYYLAGYAVECGLKACILKRVGATPELIFDERKFSERCWTHD